MHDPKEQFGEIRRSGLWRVPINSSRSLCSQKATLKPTWLRVGLGTTPDVCGSSMIASALDANRSWPRPYCDQPQDQSVTLTCVFSWSQCEVADTGSDLQALSKLRHYASWAKTPISRARPVS